jgi:hypothetical protein
VPQAVWVDDGAAEEAEEEEGVPAVPRADVADARELLSRPAEDCALFSTEAAGVQPPGLAARAGPDEVAAG